MTVWVTNMYGQARESTAQIYQNMVMEYAKELNFQEMPYYAIEGNNLSENQAFERQSGMIAGVKSNDTVIIQSPLWTGFNYEFQLYKLLYNYQMIYNVKLIVFVHDVETMMFGTEDLYLPSIINYYNAVDALILPNQKMAAYLREHGLTIPEEKIFYQKMWDVPKWRPLETPPTFSRSINFPGSPEKFKFIDSWCKKTPLTIYSAKQPDKEGVNVEVQEPVLAEQLAEVLNQRGGFGLVWEANDTWKNYMQYNTSAKFGTYIAAGLPVLAHRGSADCELIEQKKLGFVFDSLDEVDEFVQQIQPEEYAEIVQRIFDFGLLNRQGTFVKRALINAVFSVRY